MPTPRDRRILEAVRVHQRLTREHIRRLFFRRQDGGLASPQAVNGRLRKLVAPGYLEPLVVNGGHGAGPYAYGLGVAGRIFLRGMAASAKTTAAGPVWHQLEIAEFRVRLEEELNRRRGEVVEWLGEPVLRKLLLGKGGSPVPDGLVHWRLGGVEGTFYLEWDRGSESLAILTLKLRKYFHSWRARGHRELLPGLGLRPRLVIVVPSRERGRRLVEWLGSKMSHQSPATTLIGIADDILKQPLGQTWWRSDSRAPGKLIE